MNIDKGPAEDAMDERQIPSVADIVSVDLVCEVGDETSPCGSSRCVDGDLGVFCESYVKQFSGEEVRVTYDTMHIILQASE